VREVECKCSDCDEEASKIIVPPPYTFESPNILRRDGKIVKNRWKDGESATPEQVVKFIRLMEEGLDYVRKIVGLN
jgi:hypothetical protein